MAEYGVEIVATGAYVPSRVLTNHELAEMVETSDEWITARTGIRERHIAAPEETTSDMAAVASQRALAEAGLAASELDLIIVATMTPDRPLPNTGCFLQRRLGAPGAVSFSLEAACSGFLYALEVGANMIRHGSYRTALVVAAEKLSSVTDWSDRTTCVLFGDGAGVVILRRVPRARDALLASHLGADGTYAELLTIPAGGTEQPLTKELLEARRNCIRMSGREVFKLAVNAMVDSSERVLRQAGLSVADVRWLVPHQANTRIIHAVGKRLGIPNARVFINLDRYGNTSAATIPIALDEIVRSAAVVAGDTLLLTAFGGGLTWGAMVLRWQA